MLRHLCGAVRHGIRVIREAPARDRVPRDRRRRGLGSIPHTAAGRLPIIRVLKSEALAASFNQTKGALSQMTTGKMVVGVLIHYSLTSLAFAQLQRAQIDPAKVPIPQQHFQPEYTFDAPGDPLRWATQKSGLNASFGSTDQLYMRSEAPDLPNESQRWEDTGWKGERLNAQLLIWSSDTLSQIRITTSDLVTARGRVLSKGNVQVNLVRYVLSNYPYGAKDASCDVPAPSSAYLMPDRLEPLERFDLPGRTVRPIWLSLDIPSGTEAGLYQGTIEVSSDKSRVSLPVKIRVQNQLLPKPGDWKFRLDLWQNPWVVAWYYHLEPWSAEHKALLRKHLRLYADAGGKYITTYAVHSPWSDNSYMIEGSMIEWTKRVDGAWKFDYNIFDQYVQLAMEAGVNKAITIYTPVPWGHRFGYLDAKSGNYVFEEWSPESAEFKSVFSPPIEARYIGWYSAAYGYDGFLRWAYDAWPADPVRDARHTLWPAGDEFLVYPGANSSIRFEKLREGIVDYEKIKIIRELASKSSDTKIKDRMKDFDAHLASFS